MATGDEVEIFNASARPTPSAEEVAEKTRKAQEEHTNNQRPAAGDTPQQLGEKLVTLSCIHEPEPVHAEIIDQLLALGADVHVRSLGRTAIIAAAGASNAPLVKKLLAAGANPNDSDNPGNEDKLGPVICHAAYRNNPGIIRLLLDAGVDANASCYPGGRTALTLAIDYARVENEATPNTTVVALIEAGADPNKGPAGGFTPLLYALSSKMPKTAQYLLDHGADPELKPGDKATPLEIATWKMPEEKDLITGAIRAKHEKIRVAREEREHLDQWMKDGCPAEAGAKPMQKLKLKKRPL